MLKLRTTLQNHSLRATSTTTLFDAGVPGPLIQERAGHKSLGTQRVYERVTPQQENAVPQIQSSSLYLPYTTAEENAQPSDAGKENVENIKSHDTQSRPALHWLLNLVFHWLPSLRLVDLGLTSPPQACLRPAIRPNSPSLPDLPPLAGLSQTQRCYMYTCTHSPSPVGLGRLFRNNFENNR